MSRFRRASEKPLHSDPMCPRLFLALHWSQKIGKIEAPARAAMVQIALATPKLSNMVVKKNGLMVVSQWMEGGQKHFFDLREEGPKLSNT